MPRSELAVQPIATTGTDLVMTAANVDGHSIRVPANGLILVVTNGGTASITVTTDAVGKSHGTEFVDPAGSVPAGATRRFKIPGGFPYEQSNGRVNVNFSAVAGVTVGAERP